MRLTHDQRNWGFGPCCLCLRNVKGFRCNHKRVWRGYREFELNRRVEPKRRIVRDKPAPLAVPDTIDRTWPMDFMHERLGTGGTYRLLHIIDDFSRQGLAIEADFSLPSERVIRVLDQLMARQAASATR